MASNKDNNVISFNEARDEAATRRRPSAANARRAVSKSRAAADEPVARRSVASSARASRRRDASLAPLADGRRAYPSREPRAAVETYERSAESRAEARKRNRSKAKADKQFMRQFGSSEADTNAGSRAAVYTGSMGRDQRRANREMESGTADAPVFSIDRITSLAGGATPKMAIVAAVVLVAAFVMLFLYPPAKEYYTASREQDRLEAVAAAEEQRVEAIQDDIDRLSTDEGIMDIAREEYGWVREGEQAVIVEGLDDDDEPVDSAVHTSIVPSSVKTPDTWYSGFLDVVFGYDDGVGAEEESADDAAAETEAEAEAEAETEAEAEGASEQQQ